MTRGRAVAACLAALAGLPGAALPLAADTKADPAAGFAIDSVETRIPTPTEQDRDTPSWPVAARLTQPSDAYVHDILGGIPPFTVLEVTALACGACRHGWEDAWVRLPDDMVFEDTAPRLWDVTGDGRPEVVVVETHVDKGARLAVWDYPQMASQGTLTRRAATDFIGQPQRWLAPAGAADFNGDGQIEIAYVDRPHLVADLVFVRLDGERLAEVARLPGVTNHRIGDDVISGGLRDCGQGPEIVAASADWSRLLVIGWDTGPQARDAGGFSQAALTALMDCR